MKRKFIFVERLCECGCGEQIGEKRSDRAKESKLKTGHVKNKREILLIDKECECGCGEIIGNWKYNPGRKQPRYKQGHYSPTEYKGGKFITPQGYIKVRRPKKEGGTIFEHRLVMEQHLGRKLSTNEDIHHINGVKTDNRIENLEIIDHLEHAYKHGEIIRKKLDKKEIIKCFEQGFGMVETCNQLGMAHNTFMRNIKIQGLEDWFKSIKKEYRVALTIDQLKTEFTKENLKQFTQIKDIAKHYNLDRNTAAKYLKITGLYEWFRGDK